MRLQIVCMPFVNAGSLSESGRTSLPCPFHFQTLHSFLTMQLSNFTFIYMELLSLSSYFLKIRGFKILKTTLNGDLNRGASHI